jgi:hypothetical protein
MREPNEYQNSDLYIKEEFSSKNTSDFHETEIVDNFQDMSDEKIACKG